MAMSQHYSSWTTSPYPREPNQHPQDASGQALRLPPPSSLVSAPGEAPRYYDSLGQPLPAFSPLGAYAPASASHTLRPPVPQSATPAQAPTPVPAPVPQMAPQIPPQNNGSMMIDQRYGGPGVAQLSPTYSPQAPDRSSEFPGRRMSQGVVDTSNPGLQPIQLGYSEQPQVLNAHPDPQVTGQQNPSSASALPASQRPRGPHYRPPRVLPSYPEPRLDPGRIPDLNSTCGKHWSSKNVRYKLRMRQQPVAARSCGFGERDRRVIDPPPIVQLLIEGRKITDEERTQRLRYSHYIMSCSIWDETGTRDASFMPEEYRQQRRLMGSLVGAPFVGKDEFGEEGCFFCFPDLSCRTPGTFRLKFCLVMIDPARAREIKRFPVLVEAMSDVFTVFNAKDFPGMQASTKLTKRLKEQGCIISIKKGNDKNKPQKVVEDLSEGEEDEGEPSSGTRGRHSAR